MSENIQYREKFIAFVDIMGFEALVRASESNRLAAAQIVKLQHALHSKDFAADISVHGPMICPCAPRLEKSLDFQVSQVSDSLLVSAEVSPAGLINLLQQCSIAVFRLLKMGHMCRGYLKKGIIHHDGDRFFGSGYMDASGKERLVSIFKRDDDDVGTPFVEIDPEVVAYVQGCGDDCVSKCFDRLTKSDGELTALFPFKRLGHSFMIAAPGVWFDPEKVRKSVNVIRGWIRDFKRDVAKHIDPSNKRAVRKSEHYLNALDDQLSRCEVTEKMIDTLSRSLGGPPGLLNLNRWKATPRNPRT
jgi:hypothetical protein